MARCDEGYLCRLCGEEVDELAESDLYLRYIIGEVRAGELLSSYESHIKCNRFLAQFIRDEQFADIVAEAPFSKHLMDAQERQRWEELVTRGWTRLQEVARDRPPINEYPLPEFRADEAATP